MSKRSGNGMVKVMGHTVKAGSKRHRILIQQQKHAEDLQRHEVGKGRSNPTTSGKLPIYTIYLSQARHVPSQYGVVVHLIKARKQWGSATAIGSVHLTFGSVHLTRKLAAKTGSQFIGRVVDSTDKLVAYIVPVASFSISDLDKVLRTYPKGDWQYKGGSGIPNPKGKHRSNPDPSTSSEMYESFHGSPSTSQLTVTSTESYPDDLAELGTLIELKVSTVNGLSACIGFDNDSPMLCSTPDGRSLYIIGGDQSLNLDKLHLSSSKWLKDLMVIGDLTELTYRTAKEFHKMKMTDYYHKLGEETGEVPILSYDTLNSKLSIQGGQYKVKDVGIVN